jgi:hypothetical protein
MSEREEKALVKRQMREQISVQRIYLRRRTTVQAPGVRGWFKRESLSKHLVEQALKVGILDASVTLGHVGYVHGAKYIAETGPDAPLGMLPSCVELVADREVLDASGDAFGHELMDAVLVRFDGAAVSLSTMELA